ncbi:Pao retrotransposon peptidase family protein, partial [Aphelenchoides avenae]
MPLSVDSSPTDADARGRNALPLDAHIDDDDEEFTVSTSKKAGKKTMPKVAPTLEQTETTTVALALQEIHRKDWKSKAQIHAYRDQLATEIGHYANMMDRLMSIYESPETLSPDEHQDPRVVITHCKKALRRVRDQRVALQGYQQHIDDVKRIWFLWIGVLSASVNAEEMDARDNFLALEGTELYASVWREYASHRKQLSDDEAVAQDDMEWAQRELEDRRRATQPLPNAQCTIPPRTTPTSAVSTAVSAVVTQTAPITPRETPTFGAATTTSGTTYAPLFGSSTTTAAPLFGSSTTTGASLFGLSTNTAPTFGVTSKTTSATAATWSTTGRTSATTGNPGGFIDRRPSNYLSQRTTLGLQAIAQVDALRSWPEDTFASGTGITQPPRPQPAAAKPTFSRQTPTHERGLNSTSFRQPRDTAPNGKPKPTIQFAAQDEVIEITPHKDETRRRTSTRSRSASPRQTFAQHAPTGIQPPSTSTAQTVDSNATTQPPPTELSSVVSALKMVMTRMTGLEDQLKTLSSQHTTTSRTLNSPADNPTETPTGKLNVGAHGGPIYSATRTAHAQHTASPTPMQRDRADGGYVIPLPPPPTSTASQPASATASSTPGNTTTRMMAAYGNAAKDGSDFGDGIRVSAMDERNLTPEIAINSPNSIRVPEPKPFYGEFFDWPRFSSEWTHFVNSTMPDQFTLISVLKKLLKGSALTTAQRFDGHTSEEYDDLWQALCSRFHRPAQVVKHYLNTFQSIRAPTRETIPDLRQFHGEVCIAINRLKRANRDVENEMFSHALSTKITTPKLRAHLRLREQEAQRTGTEWHTTAILNATEAFIQDLEELEADNKEYGCNRNRAYRPQRTFYLQDGKKIRIPCDDDEIVWVESDEEDDKPKRKPTTTRSRSPQEHTVHVTFGEHQKKQFGKRSTPANFAPVERSKRRKPKIGPNGQKLEAKCIFCERAHNTDDCTRYKTHITRTKRLQDLNKCVYCARPGHTMDDCYLRERHLKITAEAAKIRCKFCKETTHHCVVCPQKYPHTKDERVRSPPPPITPRPEKSTHFARKDKAEHAQSDSSPPTSDDEFSDIENTYTDHGTEEDSTDEDEAPPRRQHNFNAVAHRHPTEPVSTQTLLMTTHIPVINTNAHKVQEAVPVFFDQGSSQTYITKSLAEQLGLPVNRAFHSTVHTFMDQEPDGRQIEVWEVEFDLRLLDGTTLHIVADAVDDFAAPMPTIDGHLKAVAHVIANPDLPVPIVCDTPQILIGTDYLNEFDIIRRRKPLANGFYVYDSRVGPLLNGKGATTGAVKGPQTHKAQKIFKIQRTGIEIPLTSTAPKTQKSATTPTQDALLAALQSLSSLETLGIQSSETIDDSAEVLANHRQTLQRLPDGRYETGLPWLSFVNEMLQRPQTEAKVLPTNYKPALARLNSIVRQHEGNSQVMGTYHGSIMEYLALGMVEIASADDAEGLIVHYLPHHPVFRADKPTKLRIVFDGSCRCTRHDRSINDCLHCGPNLLESIVGILLRSRFPEFLLIGDIEKAFLQISIRPQDRDALRFLWLKDPTMPPIPDNLLVLRFGRVPFGLSASPFLLLATVDHHLRSSTDSTAMEIRRNMYSDNVFLFADSINEALDKYRSSKTLFTDANMNIREFISNSDKLNNAIPELDRAKSTKEATLGLEWDNIKDVWRYRMPDPDPMSANNAQIEPTYPPSASLPDDNVRPEESSSPQLHEDNSNQHVAVCRKVQNAKYLTMRVMTSIIHSLWDPFGLFCPATLHARLLLQRVTNGGFGWDDKLPVDIADAWTEATSTWLNMTFEVKRHILASPRPHTIQMHCFVDAWGVAFAAVTYLRICDSKGNVHVTPIFAKSRVKTKKPVLTIPRLELMSVLIGCRMIEYLRKELPPTVLKPTGNDIIPTYVWCDNQGALYWMRDTAHRYGRFVQNRLDEIRRVPNVSFRYINTHDNPADVASRGATAPELRDHKLWWTGPSFLRSSEDQWPTQPDNFQPFQEDLLGIDNRAPLPADFDNIAFAVQRPQKVQTPKPTLLELIIAGKSNVEPKVDEVPPRRRTLGNFRRVT